MLETASEAIHELNKAELLPLIGVLAGAVWFMIQPGARRVPVRTNTRETDRK